MSRFGIAFDLDGTLYLGETSVPGAPRAVDWARAQGGAVRFLTNNPRRSRQTYARKLAAMGIAAQPHEVVTSSFAMVRYLEAIAAHGRRIFVLGETPLRAELSAAGFVLTEQDDAEIVIVSFDTTLTYAKLLSAHRALRAGARFVATNPDVYCPTADGSGLPDAGSLIAALQASTGRGVEMVAGKPSRFLAELLLQELGVPADRCAMVGDRAETDVRFGRSAGMLTVLVRTGATGDAPLPAELEPDHRLDSVEDLPRALLRWVQEMESSCGGKRS